MMGTLDDMERNRIINNSSLCGKYEETIEKAIKELGFGKTEHITKEKISEFLETENKAMATFKAMERI